MNSSDSEAFESADEDIIEPKTSVKNVEKKSSGDDVNKDNTKLTDPIPQNDSPEPLSKPLHVDKTVISTNIDNQRSVKEITNILKLADIEREDLILKSTSINEPANICQIEKESSKLSLNSACEFIEVEKNLVKVSNNEAKVEDDWEFDKWEEDIDDEIEELVTQARSTVPNVSSSIQSAETKEDNGEKLSDEDGWQIDDWDDDSTQTENSSIKNDLKTNEGDISNVLDKISSTKPTEAPSNWGWTPWGGMVQLISTATSHVSQVIESGIGVYVPNPEEIARAQHEEKLKNRDQGVVSDIPKDDKSMMLGNLMSGVSQIGNRVISGGLDTLEGIGKKTMTILQENDPGLLNKRKMLGIMEKDTPVLSQILREAKAKTEEAEENMKEIQKQRYKKQLHFETLFDDYHGLVHLEALEMLSQQSAIKLKALMSQLTGLALSELEETLNEVKELCELPEMDNDDSDGFHTTEELADKFNTSVEDLDITVDFKDILQCWSDCISWLENDTAKSAQDIQDKALRCLAQTSAIAINKMHKLAELLLIKDHHSTADEADSLVQFTTIMCWHLSGISSRFGNSLSQMENKEDVNSIITSIFLEGSNSTSYVQNAFQLFIPILQMGAA